MDGFGCQLLPQRPINQLMLPDAVETIKSCRNNGHLEMITTAGEILDADLSVRDGATNGGADGIRLNHWIRA